MIYSKLGNSNIEVSKICLGTMTYGEQNTQAEAFEQLDYAVEQGINFIDTAEMYPVPPKAGTQGSTESIIGNWLQQRGKRDDVILASKAAGPGEWLSYIRPELGSGSPRFTRTHLESAIETSLQRLKTDYLDLYQLHWPDRNTNYFGKLGYQHEDNYNETPLHETFEVLKELVDSGKVRHIGLSNETPWGLNKCLELAEYHGMPRAMSVQNPYNLLNRSYEVGMAEISHREQVGLLAYSPMAFGALSGKYLNGQWPEGARMTLHKRFARYFTPQGIAATEAYVTLAKQHGLDPAQMALAYVNSRGFVTSNIIGATTMAQLKNNIRSVDLELSKDVLTGIENIHGNISNPCP